MSEINTITVEGVEVSSVALSTEVSAAAEVAAALAVTLTAAAWQAFRSRRTSDAGKRLDELDAVQLETLRALRDSGHLVNRALLDNGWARLRSAASIHDARREGASLLNTAASTHQRIVVESAARACAAAAVRLGFSVHEQREGTAWSVVATNQAGRCLVAEVTPGNGGRPVVNAELLGVSDGTCGEVMARFRSALEEEGLRLGRTDRRFGGGAPVFAVGREAVKRGILRGRTPHVTSSRKGREGTGSKRPAVPTPRASVRRSR